MKQKVMLGLSLVLLIAFTGCGRKEETETNAPDSSVTADTVTEEETKPLSNMPLSDFPDSVSYGEEYVIEADPGEGLTPKEVALQLYQRVPNPDDSLKITLYGLDNVEEEECYLYRVEDQNGNVSEYAASYSSGKFYRMKEQGGEYELMPSLN